MMCAGRCKRELIPGLIAERGDMCVACSIAESFRASTGRRLTQYLRPIGRPAEYPTEAADAGGKRKRRTRRPVVIIRTAGMSEQELKAHRLALVEAAIARAKAVDAGEK